MKKVCSVGTCIGLSIAVVTHALCTFMENFSIVQWLWIGFLPMIVYFSVGAHKDFKTYLKMLCSFLCGLAWGQLSNQLYINFFSIDPLVVGIINNIVIIFLLAWIHLSFLGDTVFGFLPTVFLGFAETIGFWGRPFPDQGMGLMGELSTVEGVSVLVILFLFGLAYSFFIEVIADLISPFILRKQT